MDAVADGAVAQSKFQQQAVGAPVVQALYGVAQSRQAQGVFLTSSKYTAAAVRFAEEAGVALFVHDDEGAVTARSSRAEALLVAARERDAGWASRMAFRAERRDAERASAEVQRLLGNVRWLTAAAADRQRRDDSRKGVKAVRKALAEVDAALQQLKECERVTGARRRSHLSTARWQLSAAAGHLGVKLPR